MFFHRKNKVSVTLKTRVTKPYLQDAKIQRRKNYKRNKDIIASKRLKKTAGRTGSCRIGFAEILQNVRILNLIVINITYFEAQQKMLC